MTEPSYKRVTLTTPKRKHFNSNVSPNRRTVSTSSKHLHVLNSQTSQTGEHFNSNLQANPKLLEAKFNGNSKTQQQNNEGMQPYAKINNFMQY